MKLLQVDAEEARRDDCTVCTFVDPHANVNDAAKKGAATFFILVVGLRLGCLNHALLTSSAIRDSGCDLIGWVANLIDSDFTDCEENIATLQTRISAPMLGFVPFSHTLDIGALARSLDLDDWMAV